MHDKIQHIASRQSAAFVLSAEDCKEAERSAIASIDSDEPELMKLAGTALFDEIQKSYPSVKRIALFAGPGNNGGDALILATLLREANYQVCLFADEGNVAKSTDAKWALNQFLQSGGEIIDIEEFSVRLQFDLIVDGLFGIGLSRALSGKFLTAVEEINQSYSPVLSIDVPSGYSDKIEIDANSCIKATQTHFLIAYSPIVFSPIGQQLCGRKSSSSLNIGVDHFKKPSDSIDVTLAQSLSQLRKKRGEASHKGSHGTVVIFGGDIGMFGAIALAGNAALKSGAGKVILATHESHVGLLSETAPEIMYAAVGVEEDIQQALDSASVVVLGPGLGRSTWSKSVYDKVINTTLPLVLDADGLNLLAENQITLPTTCVMTPHPGEAKTLLGDSEQLVNTDRLAAINALKDKYKCNVVMKGSATLVHNGRVAMCPYGNPGMATAGMGDVLAGLIGGLVAQGIHVDSSADVGVLVHALAGDLAAAIKGERLTASDVVNFIPQIIEHQF